ncbi:MULTISPECIES: SHOCT domain-containing protein [Halorussus]|uniref:SHOCT domain-containing protein n=1 Tax=Halorussus TaxID=1070314 RepID=UPI000E20F657|nr:MULTISPECIES: SHOCT domain-containing protein [Halorussus]NHN60771.1 SHOCT domain-containing protein [Halorussus sp. JP-T4]
MAATPRDRLLKNATGIASTVVTGVWLAAMFTGQDWWLAALLFGYIVVVPVVAMLFGDEEDVEEWWDDDGEGWWDDGEGAWTGERETDESDADDPAETNNRDALETLRDRYARGELTDEQFERKLERLLDTESLEDVEDRARLRDEQTESYERSS